ncbi:hypothetical protein LZ575_13710 [Antarcticibacterium sp. 1MA-6-2]|uniref:hypothetical protein n=1 Tax=Antarcticibacterium sp. 1MA-6-2 TaxID=2908210 RepID=UPI001F40DDF1|nr:hypothetical protein [Antarcticibacterium sp. 1MA-6-2]UJH90000.1 hypothetical protein LZ575_13710 [Antarcticibacterium sp. 1MA-6-2]
MKVFTLITLLFLSSLIVSCDKEDEEPTPEISISNITLAETYTVGQAEEINVTIIKPTPCHEIEEESATVSASTYSYYFRLLNNREFCIQVLARDETMSVNFEPTEAGEHLLNFYIDGELLETRTVLVTE